MGLLFFRSMAKKAQVSTKDAGKGASKNAQSAKSSKGGAKAKKKSWTKVKVKEKLNNAVFLDQKHYQSRPLRKIQGWRFRCTCPYQGHVQTKLDQTNRYSTRQFRPLYGMLGQNRCRESCC